MRLRVVWPFKVARFFCLVAVLVLFCTTCSAAQKHVLVFFGQWRTLPVNAFVEEKLYAALDPDGTGDVQFYTESLDEERLRDRNHLDNVALALRSKYAGRKFDLVFATMTSSVQFLSEYGSGIFGAAPVVFCVVNKGSLAPALGENFTGTLTELNAGTNLELMLRLHPRTRRVVVIAGRGTLAQQWLQEARTEFDRVAGRVRIDMLPVDSIGDVVTAVSGLAADTLVYFVFAMRTGDGRFLAPRTVAASVAAAASVPVYVSDDRFVGLGPVGGFVMDNEASVTAAVGMASKLLAGATVRDVPVQTIQSRFLFDARQLDRWGIDENVLPRGSDVRFRTPSLWQVHKGTIIGVSVFVFLESALLFVLVVERKRKAVLQKCIAAQYEEMRGLSAKLITAHEEERRRIARDLHDDVKQRVALIGLGLSQLKRSAACPEAQERIKDLSGSANELALTLGHIAKGLHPSALDHTGLAAAVRTLARECGQRAGIEVTADVDTMTDELDPAVKLCLFRVAQEALQNVTKHSEASTVTVCLRRDEGSVHLAVTDNGRGFAMDPSTMTAGLGLLSMRERLRTVDGLVEIRTAPGSGTSVLATVPLRGAGGSHSAPKARAGAAAKE